MTLPLWQKAMRSFLMKVKESEKADLEVNIQKAKIMASGPINSWKIDGETMDWFQIGKGVHQSCILSPCLFNFYEDYIMKETLWKVLTNLDSIFKSRDITLPTKVHLVKTMVFQWSCMDMRVGL